MYVVGILRNIKMFKIHAACHTDGPRLEYVIEDVRM